MKLERRNFTEEFKREAVRLVSQPGAAKTGIARDLGVGPNLLAQWCRDAEGISSSKAAGTEKVTLANVKWKTNGYCAQFVSATKQATARTVRHASSGTFGTKVKRAARTELPGLCIKQGLKAVNRKHYRTRDALRADVFDYIERFYNPKRRHSTLGYVSPVQSEAQTLKCA
jgi:transposase-like protein